MRVVRTATVEFNDEELSHLKHIACLFKETAEDQIREYSASSPNLKGVFTRSGFNDHRDVGEAFGFAKRILDL